MDKTVKRTKDRVRLQGGTLTLEIPGKGKQVFEIGAEPVRIGRDESCDIVLASPRVSKVHAEVVATEDGTLIRDLGSTNGTFVNDVRIAPQAYIHQASKIECGEWMLHFAATRPAEIELPDAIFGPLVGTTTEMRGVFGRLKTFAPTPLSILVQGESGTGKELVAKAVHDSSDRAGKPFIVVDCANLTETLAESALFGHEKGSFTGASERRASRFAEADGGTLFLDEVGDLPLGVQQKLLRALESQQVMSVGSNKYRTVNVRVLAATHVDIDQAVNQGKFRPDLFFRLAKVRVELPPLRRRLDDIPLLVLRIAQSLDLGFDVECRTLTADSFLVLQNFDWPGNVRQLKNVVETALWKARVTKTPVDFADALSSNQEKKRKKATASRLATPERLGTYDDEIERCRVDYFVALSKLYGGVGMISKIARHADASRDTVRRYLLAAGEEQRVDGERDE